jgi:hypothetical protein
VFKPPSASALFDDGDDAAGDANSGGGGAGRPGGSGGAAGGSAPVGHKSSVGHIAVNMAVKRQQEVAAQKAAEQEQAARAEDAGIFDYDGWVEGDAAPKRAKKAEAEEARSRKPQYLQAMMEVTGPHVRMTCPSRTGDPPPPLTTGAALAVDGLGTLSHPAHPTRSCNDCVQVAKRRELESERVYERKLVRELKKDEEEFGGLEKFVTSGYKAKLAERRAKEEEERQRDALNEDVTKKKDLTGFYRHLMNEMAGEAPSAAPAAPAASRAAAMTATTPVDAGVDAGDGAGVGAGAGKRREEVGKAEAPTLPAAVAGAAAAAGRASGAAAGASDAGDAAPLSAAPSTSGLEDDGVGAPVDAGAGAVIAAPAVPVLSKAEQIAAARERALARRKAKEGGGGGGAAPE